MDSQTAASILLLLPVVQVDPRDLIRNYRIQDEYCPHQLREWASAPPRDKRHWLWYKSEVTDPKCRKLALLVVTLCGSYVNVSKRWFKVDAAICKDHDATNIDSVRVNTSIAIAGYRDDSGFFTAATLTEAVADYLQNQTKA